MRSFLIAADLWQVVGPEENEVIPRGPKGLREAARKRAEAHFRPTLWTPS